MFDMRELIRWPKEYPRTRDMVDWDNFRVYFDKEEDVESEFYCPDLSGQGNSFGTFQGMNWN